MRSKDCIISQQVASFLTSLILLRRRCLSLLYVDILKIYPLLLCVGFFRSGQPNVHKAFFCFVFMSRMGQQNFIEGFEIP